MGGFALGWEVRSGVVLWCSGRKGKDRMKGDDRLSIPGTGEERKKKEKNVLKTRRVVGWFCFVVSFGVYICVETVGFGWL